MEKETTGSVSEISAASLDPIPKELLPRPPLQIFVTASGLYTTAGVIPEDALTELPLKLTPTPIIPLLLPGSELRLDVDGSYPQMTASGSIPISRLQRVHWIAKLKADSANVYSGGIWYKDPAVSAFAYTAVSIAVTRSLLASGRSATVTFSGGGLANKVVTFAFKSPYFHQVEFEFDNATGIAAETFFDTGTHPNRPATLPVERLTIEKVYQRAGFDVRKSGGDSLVPVAGAGADAKWSNTEMHDAMKLAWSRFADKAQWSMWTLFAAQHEMGSSLGGIMFDDIGPNDRQGTSLFYNSFISDPVPGDPNSAAHVHRMRFWTAVHEMGHAFNLAHSWQKSMGVSWIPLADEPDARSFMNYPYRITGGQSAFFANFEYRFSNPELLFMRHAPGRFVEMGNAAWFDDHAFREVTAGPEPNFRLELRVNRKKPEFEFMEPVMAELKLKNISTDPQIVDENLLATLDGVVIVIKKRGKAARQYVPYAEFCMKPKGKALNPGEAIYDSVFLSAGLNGADLAEPGYYTLQACLHRQDGDVVSAPLEIRIAPPAGHDQEYVAQDFFSDDVGRVLAFDGSRVLTKSNDTLREVVDRFPESRVAIHARVALGMPLRREGKLVEPGKIIKRSAKPSEAASELNAALIDKPNLAAESLGHIDYKVYADEFANVLEKPAAKRVKDTLNTTLSGRGVPDSILKPVKVAAAGSSDL